MTQANGGGPLKSGNDFLLPFLRACSHFLHWWTWNKARLGGIILIGLPESPPRSRSRSTIATSQVFSTQASDQGAGRRKQTRRITQKVSAKSHSDIGIIRSKC